MKDFLQATDGNAQTVRLIKVRNPWKSIGDPTFKESSHGDWTGKYSRDDTTSWTEHLKALAKFNELKQGEFFMTVEDFK